MQANSYVDAFAEGELMELTEGLGRTEASIIESYIRLLGFKQYDKIKVKDVLEESGVVRSTFYKYFEDVYDLLDRIELMLLDRLRLSKLPIVRHACNMQACLSSRWRTGSRCASSCGLRWRPSWARTEIRTSLEGFRTRCVAN